MSSEEELVQVNLGNDYECGESFTTVWGPKDYLVPRSQLERWEAVQTAYEAMQAEIRQVMDEQRERIRALYAGRPKSPLQRWVEQAYAKQMNFALNASPLLRGANHQESEDDTPLLVADSKIDREEEERGL